MNNHLENPTQFFNSLNGSLSGGQIVHSKTCIADMAGYYHNESARSSLDQAKIVYRVAAHFAEKPGTTGGLFFGISTVFPGLVGQEYFMTKGHFHAIRNRSEYYWCIQGEGVLIFMDEDGNCYAEKLQQGSLHYIPRKVAHRLANTGNEPLVVGACWPSDAGHDYTTITQLGFSIRLLNIDGQPQLQKVR